MQKLDFSAAAVSATAGYVCVEPKVCHRCGAGFYRPVPAQAKHGLKFCAKCAAWFVQHSTLVRGKSIQ